MNRLNYITSLSIHVLIVLVVLFITRINATNTTEEELARAETIQVMFVQPISVPEVVKTNSVKDMEVNATPVIKDAVINVSDKANKQVEKTQIKAKAKEPEVKDVKQVKEAVSKPIEVSNQGSLEDPKDKIKAKITQAGIKDGSSATGNAAVAGYSDSVVRLLQPQIALAQRGKSFSPDLVIIIKVNLSKEAKATKVKIVKSSRDIDFDQLVMDIVNANPKFPDFPSNSEYDKFKELTLTFKPE